VAALTLLQRKNLTLGIVDPANSVYNSSSNNVGNFNTTTQTSQSSSSVFDASEPVALVFDVIPTEENALENVGTTNPIETGGFVSDMIRTMPEKATFTAVISQATLANILGLPVGAILGLASDRVTDAYNYIHDNIMVAKAIFDFVSGLKVYQTYYMSSFKVNRDPETAMCLSCTFTITQLNIVGATLVNGLAPQPVSAPSSAVPQEDLGQTATEQATNFQQADINGITNVYSGAITQTGNSFGGSIQ
jgi:hypothetical protein